MEEQIVDILVNLYPNTKITEKTWIRALLTKEIEKANLSEKVAKAILTGACGRLREEIMIEYLRERPMNDKIATEYLIKMLMEVFSQKTKEDLIKMLARW